MLQKKSKYFFKSKYFLSIAATDTSSASGIQQDLRMSQRLGFWGLSAITAITSQSFNSAESIDILSEKTFQSQLEIIFKNFEISAIKIGVLPTIRMANILIKYLDSINCPVVYDPVSATSSGMDLLSDNISDIYKVLQSKCTVVTPNLPEYKVIKDVNSSCYIYIKGGHSDKSKIVEYLISGEHETKFEFERHNWTYSRGTGCAFSSLLSMYLVDNKVEIACRKAHETLVEIYK